MYDHRRTMSARADADRSDLARRCVSRGVADCEIPVAPWRALRTVDLARRDSTLTWLSGVSPCPCGDRPIGFERPRRTMHAVLTGPPLSAAEFAVAHHPARDPDLRRALPRGSTATLGQWYIAKARYCFAVGNARRHCDSPGRRHLQECYLSADARNA